MRPSCCPPKRLATSRGREVCRRSPGVSTRTAVVPFAAVTELLSQLAGLSPDARDLPAEVLVVLLRSEPRRVQRPLLQRLRDLLAPLRQPDRARDRLLAARILEHLLRRLAGG